MLPRLSILRPFLRGSHITAEHIKFLEDEGFNLQIFNRDHEQNFYHRDLTTYVKDKATIVTMIITRNNILLQYPAVFMTENFKLNFHDYARQVFYKDLFAYTYEEALKRVYNLHH